jgi:hypothetical protein
MADFEAEFGQISEEDIKNATLRYVLVLLPLSLGPIPVVPVMTVIPAATLVKRASPSRRENPHDAGP